MGLFQKIFFNANSQYVSVLRSLCYEFYTPFEISQKSLYVPQIVPGPDYLPLTIVPLFSHAIRPLRSLFTGYV